MQEEIYTLLGYSDSNSENKKSIEVEKQKFIAGSEAALIAKKAEQAIYDIARYNTCKIICNGEVVYDPDLEDEFGTKSSRSR